MIVARALALAAIAATFPCSAQDRPAGEAKQPGSALATPAGAAQTYPADFYAAFQPQTVLDMLARTPGFTLEAGDPDILLRGFGANAGNVLIDGQRPTVKAGGVTAVLGRISASRVERIELLRGALTAEAQGQTLVANIVLKAGTGASGTVQAELRRAPGDGVTPKVELSYARALGSWEMSGGLIAFYERNPFAGRYEFFGPDGASLSRSREALAERRRGATLTGSASRPLAGGALSINARLNHEREAYVQRITPTSGTASRSRIDGLDVDWDGELGTDWTRGLGGDWTVKLVGLARAESSDFSEGAMADDATSAFAQSARTTELVGRATLSRQGSHILRPEIGGEMAWNRLSSRLAFTEAGAPIVLPGSDVRVAEVRAEAFANLSVQLARTVRLEGGIAYERSRITVDGDGGTARTLGYWRPSAAVLWDATASLQARLGWRRTVGQLDFENFAATGNLIDDRPIAGNAELRPEVTDSLSLKLDYRFGNGGALSLTGARETIGDALTYVPLAGGGEALLNFGRVDLWSIKTEATLPLDRVVKGARLSATGSATRARRPDPVGGRRDDYRDYSAIALKYRHDVAAWQSAYGVEFEMDTPERAWFTAEFQRTRYRPYVSGYIETAMLSGIKTTLTVSGITGEREYRRRDFYAPDRAGTLVGVERRTRARGAYVNLLFVRQF